MLPKLFDDAVGCMPTISFVVLVSLLNVIGKLCRY
jgi:hypothetical protein